MSTLVERVANVSDKLVYAASAIVLVGGLGYAVWASFQPDHGLPHIDREDFRQTCNAEVANRAWKNALEASPLATQFFVAVDSEALNHCMDEKFHHFDSENAQTPFYIGDMSLMAAVALGYAGYRLQSRRKEKEGLTPAFQ